MANPRFPQVAFPALVALCFAVPAARAATVEVRVGGTDAAFHPPNVTINVGDTVVWFNDGGFHNVSADDASFRCANGCDGVGGGDGSPSSSAWTFSRVFSQPGTVGYHCEEHGTPTSGMRGSVIVQGGGDQPGTLRFSLANYLIGEGTGPATISVQRINGDDGAVTVDYKATAGTATAGQDFTAVTGTLSWGNGDDGARSFNVPITNDTTPESNETISLALSAPTGGAALDNTQKTAVVTIQDNDGGSGGSLTAPSNLVAAAASTGSATLTWVDNSTGETGFRVERRKIDGTYGEIDVTGANVTNLTVPGLDPSTFYLFRVRATNGAANSAYSNEAGVATLGDIAACVPDAQTLCLTGGRFKVQADWRAGTLTGTGQAVPLPSAPDSGLFYFFSSTNIEILLKTLNACTPQFNRYWVFFAATTNVEFAVVVTDTHTGRTKGYFNPFNRPAPPVQDVDAFATCP